MRRLCLDAGAQLRDRRCVEAAATAADAAAAEREEEEEEAEAEAAACEEAEAEECEVESSAAVESLGVSLVVAVCASELDAWVAEAT